MNSAVAKPVVVGIDGSEQSEYAARWAVEEAVGRDAPLRLVYVVRTDLTGPLSAAEYRAAVDQAKSALHAVRTKIEDENRPVAVETEISEGSPAGVLLAESPDAAMICVGSSGIGRLARAVLGSTAATVAERASCSVAIIRSPGEDGPAAGHAQGVAAGHAQGVAAGHAQGVGAGHAQWVMVPVSVYTDNDAMSAAIDQARLLGRPVLAVGVWHAELGGTPYDAVDNLVAGWREQYPDVHIYPVATDATMTRFLHEHPELAGLVVVDAECAGDVAAIIGTAHQWRSEHAERAVLVARDYADCQTSSTPSMG